MSDKKILVLTGPTASGKTWAALQAALEHPMEAISADSRQVYRGLDIGTAKPSQREQQLLPHHLIDILDPHEIYSAGQFMADTLSLIPRLHEQGITPLVLGGTGMYLRGLIQGYQFSEAAGDPHLRKTLIQRYQEEGKEVLYEELQQKDPTYAAKIHPNDQLRIVRGLEVILLTGKGIGEEGKKPHPLPVEGVAIIPEKEVLAERIAQRTEQLLEGGWISEVRSLLDQGVPEDAPALQSIGYPEVVAHLKGELTMRQVFQSVSTKTRQYARKQMQLLKNFSSLTVVSTPEEAVQEVLRHVAR